jgi:hypothetical protein
MTANESSQKPISEVPGRPPREAAAPMRAYETGPLELGDDRRDRGVAEPRSGRDSLDTRCLSLLPDEPEEQGTVLAAR